MKLNCFEDLMTQLQRKNVIPWPFKERLNECAAEALSQGGSLKISLNAIGEVNIDIIYKGEAK